MVRQRIAWISTILVAGGAAGFMLAWDAFLAFTSGAALIGSWINLVAAASWVLGAVILWSGHLRHGWTPLLTVEAALVSTVVGSAPPAVAALARLAPAVGAWGERALAFELVLLAALVAAAGFAWLGWERLRPVLRRGPLLPLLGASLFLLAATLPSFFVQAAPQLAFLSQASSQASGLPGTEPQTQGVPPPATPQLPAEPEAVTVDGLSLSLDVTPNSSGQNRFVLQVVDASTQAPVDGASGTLTLSSLTMNMGSTRIDLTPAGHGRYAGSGVISMDLGWQAVAQLQLPSGRTEQASFRWLVPRQGAP